MSKRVRRLFASLMILVMALGLLPQTASFMRTVRAAEKEVSTWDELREAVANAGDGDVIKLTQSFRAESAGIVITKNVTIQAADGQKATIYRNNGDANFSLFEVKDGGNLTLGEGLILSGKTGPDDTRTIYTNESFNSGANVSNPRGFFVQVTDGTATLNGAVLEYFNTSNDKNKTVKFAAPVVANGKTARFDIVNGEIRHNIVGYIANDEMSDREANTIKMYVKGAVPNSPRKGANATSAYRRNKTAGIDDLNGDGKVGEDEKGSGITGTAGAVIYQNGAQGTISNAKISYNRGDTGAIMVSGKSQVIMKNGTIERNVGVQFGGAVLVEDDGSLTMEDGTMKENVAWWGGGAVFATENGIKWLLGEITDKDKRLDGKFIMKGGTLDGNTAFTRGGAILVDSDGVFLNAGSISNNMSRMLGGAAYVMGDHPDFTYTLFLAKGSIHDNKAVSGTLDPNKPATALTENKDENRKLSKVLRKAADCYYNDNPAYDLWTGDMTRNSDDLVDGPGNDGTGGGIWLCSYGEAILHLEQNTVVINDNYASGTVRNNRNSQPNQAIDNKTSNKSGGNDLHKDAGGSIEFIGQSNWYDENTGEEYDSQKETGLRNLVYKGSASQSDGVKIFGNIARRGGGLASDGILLLGNDQDLANIFATLHIKKEWGQGTTDKDIMIQVKVIRNGKEAVVGELPLTKAGKLSSEMDTAFDDGQYAGRLMLPVTVKSEDGTTIPVFSLKYVGDDTRSYKTFSIKKNESFDLSITEHLILLAQILLENVALVEIDADNSSTLGFTEYIKDAGGAWVEQKEYLFSPGSVEISNTQGTIKAVKTPAGKTYSVFTSQVDFTAKVVNKAKPTVKINKTDISGSEELEGAKIVVTDANGKTVADWTSEKGKTKDFQVDPGTYTLKEVSAPEGYQLVTTEIRFEVDADGNITVLTTNVEPAGGAQVINGVLVLMDKVKPTVKINKTDISGSEELEGAKIVVTDANGKTVADWTSEKGKTKDFQVDPGTYTLKEEAAPEGYQLVTTEIQFKVDVDGNITVLTTNVEPAGGAQVINGVLVLMDKIKPTVKINKTDISGSKELEGAKIVVKDAYGKKIAQWTSEKGKTLDIVVDPGTYTLKEEAAPEGYQLVTTEIVFKVDADGKITVITTKVEPAGGAEVIDGVLVLKDMVKNNPSETTASSGRTGGGSKTTSTDTGDHSNILPYVGLMVLALVGTGVLLVLPGKKSEEE